jgi:hypothetical protein
VANRGLADWPRWRAAVLGDFDQACAILENLKALGARNRIEAVMRSGLAAGGQRRPPLRRGDAARAPASGRCDGSDRWNSPLRRSGV